MKTLGPRLRWVLLTAVTVALFALIVSRIDRAAFLAALSRADPTLLALAGAVNLFLLTGAGVGRMWTLLRPIPHHGGGVTVAEVTWLQLACAAAFNLLPTPGGDLVRTTQLTRHGYALGAVVAVQLVEKVVEALGLALVTIGIAALGRLPLALEGSLYGFAGAAVAGTVVMVVLAMRRAAGPVEREGRIARFLGRLGEGIRLLGSFRVWAAALAWTIVADAANTLAVGLCLAAVGLHLEIANWFLVMLVTRLVGVLPSTPGYFGVVEGVVVVTLALLGVDRGEAFAFGLLYHAAHFAPVTLAGLIALRRLPSVKQQRA